jgi:hypothetical protein
VFALKDLLNEEEAKIEEKFTFPTNVLSGFGMVLKYVYLNV